MSVLGMREALAHRGQIQRCRARAAPWVRAMQRRWYHSPQGPSQPIMAVSAW